MAGADTQSVPVTGGGDRPADSTPFGPGAPAVHAPFGASSGQGGGAEVPLASTGAAEAKRSSGPFLLALGAAAVVVAVIALVVLNQIGDGDDGDAAPGSAASGIADSGAEAEDSDSAETSSTIAEETDSTIPEEKTTTTVATTTSTTEPPFSCAGLCAHVENVSVEPDGELLIDWTSTNYEADVNDIHAHFFYNIYEAEQVGTNNDQYGVTRGDWQLTDENPFGTRGSNVFIAGAPEKATQICVVAADSGHGVINPENVDCFDIP